METTINNPISRSNKAAGQNITVGVVVNGELVLNDVMVTDEDGMIVLNILKDPSSNSRKTKDSKW